MSFHDNFPEITIVFFAKFHNFILWKGKNMQDSDKKRLFFQKIPEKRFAKTENMYILILEKLKIGVWRFLS